MSNEKDIKENSNEFSEESNVEQINGFVTSDEEPTEEVEIKEDESLDKVHEIEDDSEEISQKDESEETAEDAETSKEESEDDSDKEDNDEETDKKPVAKKIVQAKKLHKVHKAEKTVHTTVQNHKKAPVVHNTHKDTKPKKVEHKSEPKKVQSKPEVKKMEKPKNGSNGNGNGKHKNGKSKSESKDTDSKFTTKNLLIWIGIGVLAIILIVALILLTKNDTPVPVVANETNTSVAATVNGEPIYMQDIMVEYNKLNPLLQQVYGIEHILNKTIDDLLLYQEAKNIGLIVKSEEVESELDTIKKANMMSTEELESALKAQGLTLEDAKKLIEKNILIRKLLNTTVLKDIVVTSEDIKNYYESNTKEFEVPEKVTVQHILVMIDDQVTDAEAKTKINQIDAELNASNFCQLVIKYSQDPGSVQTCGVYTFANGEFNNPEFENPSFSMKIGEKTIVKTMFGYHIIKKLDTTPATTLELSKVSEDIKTKLNDKIAQEKFDALLARLRSEAEIVNYIKTESVSEVKSVSTEVTMDGFAKCLTEKGAKFYGAYWCPHCENQKALFEDSIQYITYVECAVKDQPQVQTAECTDAEISGYPTWVVNGLQYPGEQSIERLSQLTGCVAP